MTVVDSRQLALRRQNVAPSYATGFGQLPFLDLLRGVWRGAQSVAVIPQRVAEALGTDATELKLSTHTVLKQLRRHPEIGASEYRMVQRVLDVGEVYRDRENHVAVLKVGRRNLEVVAKRTQDDAEVYLVSLRYVNPKWVAKRRKKGAGRT
ncbi:MAG: hypothetical protein EAZ24_08640 [Burkholderiales bacterium]|nr:MAG: hypothetical protein EAZ24_08640 [Burkholderiales bacterium]